MPDATGGWGGGGEESLEVLEHWPEDVGAEASDSDGEEGRLGPP